MLKEIFEIPDKIQPNARFFRLLILIAIFIIIISKLPWVDRLMARVISVPDLRHNVAFQSTGDRTIITVEVINVGYTKAENVFFHFQSRNGKIDGFFVNSEDIYEVQQIDPESGILNLKLMRLAPRARLRVEITGRFDPHPDYTYVSVTSDQGSSIIGTELPSFSAQVQGYTSAITIVYNKTLAIIKRNLQFDEQKLRDWGITRNIIGFSEMVSFFESDDFKTVVSATVLLSLLIGLFFPHLTWLIPLMAAVGVVLTANFQVSSGFIASVTLVLSSLLLLGGIRFSRESALVVANLIFFIFGALLYMALSTSWGPPVSARWLAIPTMIMVACLLRVISIIIPKERSGLPDQKEEHRVATQVEPTLLQVLDRVTQISERLVVVETQLSQQQALIGQLFQKYTAVEPTPLQVPDQVTQIFNQLAAMEKQLSQQQASIGQLSQKYTAIIKALRRVISNQEDSRLLEEEA